MSENLNNLKLYSNKQSFSLTVKPYWFDVAGTPVPDNTAFFPPFDQPTDFPYFLFCQFDKAGLYSAGLKLFPLQNIDVNLGVSGASVASLKPQVHWRYDGLFEVGKNQSPTVFFTGFINSIGINIGDLVLCFTAYGFNVAPNPGYLFLVISCPQTNYLSLITNTALEDYLIDSIDMFCQNPNQNIQAIHFVTMDKFGLIKSNQVNPMLFKTVDYEQNIFIHMPLNIRLNRFKGFYSLFKWTTTKIEYVFTIKK